MKRDTFLCSMLMTIGGSGIAGLTIGSGLFWILETFGPTATYLVVMGALTAVFGAGLVCRLNKWGR